MNALLLLLALIAPPRQPPTLRIQFVHEMCHSMAVTVGTPVNYDVPPWDDAVGAQAGVWTTPTGTVIGYSYQEDGIVYRTAHGASECPVYPES